jgi:hypothetical protein
MAELIAVFLIGLVFTAVGTTLGYGRQDRRHRGNQSRFSTAVRRSAERNVSMASTTRA